MFHASSRELEGGVRAKRVLFFSLLAMLYSVAVRKK
jgi:hypothetical protein